MAARPSASPLTARACFFFLQVCAPYFAVAFGQLLKGRCHPAGLFCAGPNAPALSLHAKAGPEGCLPILNVIFYKLTSSVFRNQSSCPPI